MGPVHVAGAYRGVVDILAALTLVVEFGMLRQALARDQIRLYAAQSALISVLAIVIGAGRGLTGLFALAGLSAALKVVAIPLVMRRLLRGPGRGGSGPAEAPGVAGSLSLSLASTVLWSLGLAAFGAFTFTAMNIHSPVAPAAALAIAAAMVLVSFALMIVRRDAVSQAIGYFSLDNAISLASLVVAAGLPLILETLFLFDLLVAVVVFGLLMRARHARGQSLSTAGLTKLRG